MWLIAIVLAGAGFLYLLLSANAPNDIYQKFGLTPGQWKLISSDLGKGYSRMRLAALGVGGEPDALFSGNRTGQMVVGEFKNRRHRGYVRRREYYQVILYIGLARAAYGSCNVVGILAYNDARVEIAHDEALFQALIQMRGEVLGSMKQRTPINSKPLHKRMSVSTGNRKIRFPAA